MATHRFLDTNIFLRHYLADDPEKARAVQQLLLRVEAGAERATTSSLVLFELVFILHRTYKVSKAQVIAVVGGLLEYRGLHLADKHLWREALAVWADTSLDFTDAFNVACMRQVGITEIYAYDKGYTAVSGITRLEPAADDTSEQDEAA